MQPIRRRVATDRPRVRDTVTVVLLFGLTVGGSVLLNRVVGLETVVWPNVIVTAIACAALYWRRSHPRSVVCVTAACAMTAGALGYLLTPLVMEPLIFALYSMGARSARRTTWGYAAGVAVALAVTGVLVDAGHQPLFITAVNPAAWVLLPAAVGNAVQMQRAYVAEARARAEHAEQTREQEARHRVAHERMRIARELHDVVAHHLALVNAQAGTAAHLARTHPEQAFQILGTMTDTTASALRELKTTIGLLRQDAGTDSPLAPAPGLDQLHELTDAFRTAGLTIDITTEGTPRKLPAGTDLAAFRILQEALTNITKHADTTVARVRLDYEPSRLTLTVTNDGPVITEVPASKGFGLIGMRERARSLNGSFHAGPRPEGGFDVTCVLPVPPGNHISPREDRTT